ncbi:MAG: molybdopterin molybdotransferase MoeA [Rhizobacter sp.]
MSDSRPSLQEIASCVSGYDPNALPVAQAAEFIARMVSPVAGIEVLAIRAALGRVLARDVVSASNVPAADNSAMDGFALRGSDLAEAGDTVLQSVGTGLAGQPFAAAVEAGHCLRIMTGAVMPPGLDTVVPQELVRVEGDRIVVPAGAVRPGDNRRRAGEDLAIGDVALQAGRILRPADIGLLASLGDAEVPVRRRLRVAFFSTGDELRSLGEPLEPGCVYDSNRYTLWSMLQRLGVDALDMGVVRDDPAALEAAFRLAAASTDAIITSGGVSVGEADHTKQVMARVGDVLFWRIAMRPGRPMAIGRIATGATGGAGAPDSARAAGRASVAGSASTTAVASASGSASAPDHASAPGGAVLFGLPGNPVAVMVTFYALVRDALLAMSGATAEPAPRLLAASASAIRKRPGRTEYQRGVLSRAADGSVRVALTGAQGSGILRSMSQANCLVVLGHEQGDVAAGGAVEVLPFEGLV